MSETIVSNDRGTLRLEARCEGCNGHQAFAGEAITLTMIHGIITYVNLACDTCQEYTWVFADGLRRELTAAGIDAKEIVARCPGIQRGVWVIPNDPTLSPELITDSESEYLASRF